jgi:hypothetical protein
MRKPASPKKTNTTPETSVAAKPVPKAITPALKAPAKPAPKPAVKAPAAAPAAPAVAAKAAPKRVAKPTVAKTVVAKPVVAKPVAAKAAAVKKVEVKKVEVKKVAAKPLKPAKPKAAPAEEPVRAKAAASTLVRDSFTMPAHEYEVLGKVKKACLKAGFEIKKSELLRIGVALISQMDMATLQRVLGDLPQLKTGRPKKV